MPEDRQHNFFIRGRPVLIRIQDHEKNHLKLHINLCADTRMHITYFIMNTDFIPQSADRG